MAKNKPHSGAGASAPAQDEMVPPANTQPPPEDAAAPAADASQADAPDLIEPDIGADDDDDMPRGANASEPSENVAPETPAELEARLASEAAAQAAGDARDAEAYKSEHGQTVRRAFAAVLRNPPPALAQSGAWEDPKNEANHFTEKYDLPAGRYRLRGLDYIITIRRDRIVAVDKARPTTDPSTYTEFPAHG